jgi:hypothetical protein
MFLATALVYPCVLVILCAGAGLLVDRLSGAWLPPALLLTVGAAALIAVSQLITYISPLAAATPYALLAAAAAGWWLQRARVAALGRRWRAAAWPLFASVVAYVIALAPVLAAGRPTFSSFMALADSAVHMAGGDYLLHHGQDYAHLDLRNSYGQFINNYYNSSYPSGADTLFAGSAALLGLPLIWAFQPFCAFALATCAGPAWLLLRLLGLTRPLAVAAALSVTLPALVYGYELIGSIKELVALPVILTLASLMALHRRWLSGEARGSAPFAIVAAAGISALGIGFATWVLAPLLVLAAGALGALRAGRLPPLRLLALAGAGAAVGVLAALPTWLNLAGSLRVAKAIASTSNPGNLHSPLHRTQVLGVWLHGSYKLSPAGSELALTRALIAVGIVMALLGAAELVRRRFYALAAWIALTLAGWLLVDRYATTWAGAKTLMLTSPVVVLLCWAGVAALARLPRRRAATFAAMLPAVLLLGGAIVSDAIQYRASNLAPTARYRELASVNDRFAGRGPAVFTDFDEYSLYVLRGLDIGGPDFAYPPPALAASAGFYGGPVDLGAVPPAALDRYPLIVSRRDPAVARPPSAYRLLWSGSYYEVWGRAPGARAATAHVALGGAPALQCSRIGRLARSASSARARLVAADAPQLVRVALLAAPRPAGWGRQRQGLTMNRPGRLTATFALPASGRWNLWVQGQIMPDVEVRVDGRPLASVGGELGGNSLVLDTAPALPAVLATGSHRLSVTRGSTLAPGDKGSAVLGAIFLTPAAYDPQRALRAVPVAGWRSLCGRSYSWVELVAA